MIKLKKLDVQEFKSLIFSLFLKLTLVYVFVRFHKFSFMIVLRDSSDYSDSEVDLPSIEVNGERGNVPTSVLCNVEGSLLNSNPALRQPNLKCIKHNQDVENTTFQLDLRGCRVPSSQPQVITELENNIDIPKNIDAMQNWIFPQTQQYRNYQKEFCEQALFHNLLLALPTGLGKTFIAAVVMLNYFRWFPESKIIFLAPTKPLLLQQRVACSNVAGMSPGATAELNGEVSPDRRLFEYNTKRVFFMTPQTLQNDLKEHLLDAKSIICLIFDEAHRATGNHSYAQVMRAVLRSNSHFRVLGLTATPGSSTASVQKVVDCLHISKLIVRNEESIDIRSYVFHKKIQLIKVTISSEMNILKSDFANLYRPYFNFLRQKKLIPINCECLNIKAYTLFVSLRKYSFSSKNVQSKEKSKIMSCFTLLISCAHITYLLDCHGIIQFYQKLVETKNKAEGKGSGQSFWLFTSKPFAFYLEHLHNKIQGLSLNHPKMNHLLELLKEHFKDTSEGYQNQRVMIFTEFRNTAEYITTTLLAIRPMVRASLFIGQANSAYSTGMNQMQQKETIDQFRAGVINTLVATSIGEEGLDIGDTDMIICYDASSSPIRTIQRMGRTGRKKSGKVFVLLTEDCEDSKWERSQVSYRRVQKVIESGKKIALKKDVPRLIPSNIQPIFKFQALQNNADATLILNSYNNNSSSLSPVNTLANQAHSRSKRYLPFIVDDVFEDMESNLRVPTEDAKIKRFKSDYRSCIYNARRNVFSKPTYMGDKLTKFAKVPHSLLTLSIYRRGRLLQQCSPSSVTKYLKYEEKFKRKRMKKTSNALFQST